MARTSKVAMVENCSKAHCSICALPKMESPRYGYSICVKQWLISSRQGWAKMHLVYSLRGQALKQQTSR